MKNELEETSGEAVNLAVYIGLLALTAATVSAGLLHDGGRIMVVSVALIIASMKAAFIGFYYMGLRRESKLPWVILGIGALTVAILFVGILPDLTFARF